MSPWSVSSAIHAISEGTVTNLSNGEKGRRRSLILSEQQRAFLENALTGYQDQLEENDDAQAYLSMERGLSRDRQVYFRLGYVAEPADGHDEFVGRIVIPYITRAGVVGMKFRAIGEAKAKYLNLRKQPPRIFNSEAFFSGKPYIAITEGEIDAITAHGRYLPTAGMPGVDSWQPWFGRPFEGYEWIYVLADADDKGQGMRFANEIADRLENVIIKKMPEGHDVNSFVVESGYEALLEHVGIRGER